MLAKGDASQLGGLSTEGLADELKIHIELNMNSFLMIMNFQILQNLNIHVFVSYITNIWSGWNRPHFQTSPTKNEALVEFV